MLHPEREAISCALCREYYLDEDGRPLVLQGGPNEERVPRQEPPDCQGACPKLRPGMAPWDDRNARFYRRYREARALGASAVESQDDLFRYLSGLVHEHEELVKMVFQVKVTHGH